MLQGLQRDKMARRTKVDFGIKKKDEYDLKESMLKKYMNKGDAEIKSKNIASQIQLLKTEQRKLLHLIAKLSKEITYIGLKNQDIEKAEKYKEVVMNGNRNH